jgi:CheY-like chemotaxis protein
MGWMESAVQTASRTGGADLGPLPILIVDDDRAVLDAVTELLQNEGYNVATARDGRAALEHLRGGLRPCVILLDLMMPGMDGWDFRQEQLRQDDLKDIPVVIITGAGFSDTSVKAQFGAIEFVPKPPAPAALLDAVRRSCGAPIREPA